MIETMIKKEELLTDTPFLRRIRNEGSQSSSRRDILSVLKWRFDPPISHYEQIQQALKSITATEQLEELLKLAVQATDLSDFQKGLQVQVNQQATQQTNGEKQ